MSFNLKKMYQSKVAKGLPPVFLGLVYLLITVLPVILIMTSGLPARVLPDEIATYLGLFAYIWILLSFLLSGRFRVISGKIGIDKTMRYHQIMAVSLGVIVFLHPYLYTLSLTQSIPWESSRQFYLSLTFVGFVSGMLAWIVVLGLIPIAIYRDELDFRYETWRLIHGLTAVIVVIGGTIHVFDVGRYTNEIPALKFLWISLIVLASLTLWRTYLIIPLLQKSRPYKVVSNLPAAAKTWDLTIASNSKKTFNFTAGQFVWLKLKPPQFALEENPFSISSAPSDLPNIRLSIKEAGDTTNHLGDVKPGDVVYIDGPHGHFMIDGRTFAGILMIGGGIGVAPMIGIIREMVDAKDLRPVKLLYGNRTENQIAFKDELIEASKSINLEINFALAEAPEGWQGHQGNIDKVLIEKVLKTIEKPQDWLFLLCGPPGMLDYNVSILNANGINNHQIEYEKFSYLS